MDVALAPTFRPPAARRHRKPLGAVGILAGLARNPVEIWSDIHFERPVLIGKTFFGWRAVVSDPASIRRIFLDNAQNYRKDAVQLRVLKPGLGSGLLTVDGEAWKVQRRTLAPLFSPRQVAAFAPAMHRVARLRAEAIASRHDGVVVEAQAEMALVALKVLEQTLFSQGLGREASQFQKAMTRYFDTIGRIDPLDVLGAPDFLPRLGRLRGKEPLAFFAGAVEDIIAARRALIASGAAPPEDLLTLLLRAADPETGRGLSEEDVRANIVTFIGAGHETTANALTWALQLIAQSPAVEARLHAELDAVLGDRPLTPAAVPQLIYTEQVFAEALRLRPPVWMMARRVIEPLELGGHRLEKNCIVFISPWLMHHDPRYYPDPERFDPERFSPEAKAARPRFTYFPFSAGPRNCIGEGFAWMEGVLLLATLARRFRFRLVPGHRVEPEPLLTLRPKHGMPMLVQAR
jgi:cytochrome P450